MALGSAKPGHNNTATRIFLENARLNGENCLDAERRQVTGLFTDMVGFTSFSERAGDGIMAIFGAPVAFEDAPLRACRAALLIHERIAAAAGALEIKFAVRPRMRIGINTGLAVIGRVQAGEDANVTVLGDTEWRRRSRD